MQNGNINGESTSPSSTSSSNSSSSNGDVIIEEHDNNGNNKLKEEEEEEEEARNRSNSIISSGAFNMQGVLTVQKSKSKSGEIYNFEEHHHHQREEQPCNLLGVEQKQQHQIKKEEKTLLRSNRTSFGSQLWSLDHSGEIKEPKQSEILLDEALEDHYILLPNHHDHNVSHFALDIGGSLIKMVYYTLDVDEPTDEQLKNGQNDAAKSIKVSLQDKKIGARICFARFRTADIEDCLKFIKKIFNKDTICKTVHATGGGSVKFASVLQQNLGITIKKVDEMEALVSGLNFLLKYISDEAFVFTNHVKEYVSFKDQGKDSLYPYLLVNIGSGVSIIKVDGDKQYQRVSGTSLGGGTFWGLCSMLTGVENFNEMLELTKTGDNKNVDMLVGDIYGRDYAKIGLSSETIASSFSKPIMKGKSDSTSTDKRFNNADMAKSLLYMICNNIGQIAYLNALRFNLKRIFFAGYFIRDHAITMTSISYAIKFWSQGQISAMFLKHEGYLGAIGSFFKNFKDDNPPSSPPLGDV